MKVVSNEISWRSRSSWLDYLLCTIGGLLAVFSLGKALGQDFYFQFFGGIMVVGYAFSYSMRSLISPDKTRGLDTIVYAIVLFCAFLFVRNLNPLLGVFALPTQILAAGMLGWMLVFGSFFAWRDGTLMFQTVPAISIFGLVGAYDTFRDVSYVFFGFLLCLSALLSRANSRDLMRRASRAGFFGNRHQDFDPSLYEAETARLSNGPWKNLAGAEIALVAATAVVAVSFVGAPIIQTSVQGVVGNIRYTPPRIQNPTNPNNPAASGQQDEVQLVGQGPVNLSDTPVAISSEYVDYLRTGAAETYTGKGWQFPYSRGSAFRREGLPEDAQEYGYLSGLTEAGVSTTIATLVQTTAIPTPARAGTVLNNDGLIGAVNRGDGTWGVSGNSLTAGQFFFPNRADSSPPRKSVQNQAFERFLTDRNRVTPRVKELAEDSIRGAKTDYDKAVALRIAISQTITYNTQARAVPSGADAVDYKLFEDKEAYCDIFASAMVMMSRSVGLPARYVVGYLVKPDRKDKDQNSIVTESDGHAWAEVFFEGHGWVIFDATEGAREVENQGVGSVSESGQWYEKRALWLVIGFVGLAFALFSAARAFSQYKNRPAPSASQALSILVRKYETLLRKEVKRPRYFGETLEEFTEIASKNLATERDSAIALTKEIERLSYGPGTVEEQEVTAFGDALSRFEQGLKDMKKTGAPAV